MDPTTKDWRGRELHVGDRCIMWSEDEFDEGEITEVHPDGSVTVSVLNLPFPLSVTLLSTRVVRVENMDFTTRTSGGGNGSTHRIADRRGAQRDP